MKRILLILFLLVFPVLANSAWVGVDKAVVEMTAAEYNRRPQAVSGETESGDMPLFAFLAAGAVGGFIAGYSFRMLSEKRKTGR